MPSILPAQLKVSYDAFQQYPKHRIHLPFADGIVEDYYRRLEDAEANNYQLLLRPETAQVPQSLAGIPHPKPSNTEVIFWETTETSPNMELYVAKSDEQVEKKLHDPTLGPEGAVVKDPLCRFMFVRGESSLSQLFLTKTSLQRVFAYHQIMPALFSLLCVFGRREKPIDYISHGFREESYINSLPRDFEMASLGRHARHFQLCYTLRTAALKSPKTRQWSLRPVVVHHQFHMSDDNKATTLWMIAEGNLEMYKKVKLLTGPTSPDVSRDFTTSAASFRASLVIHIAHAHCGKAGWHQYINELAERVRDKTALALDDERKDADTRHDYTSDEVRLIQATEEELDDAAACIRGNIKVLTALSEYYYRLSKNQNFQLRKTCGEDISSFIYELENVKRDLDVELERVGYHTKTVVERKALIGQYLQVQQNEINTSLGLDTRRIASASQREAVSVSIITVITLFFLPATFVSTLLSSNVIDCGNGNKTASIIQWATIVGPLTAGTLLVALVMFFFRYDRKKQSILPRWNLEKE